MKCKKLLKEFCLRFVAGVLGILVLALVVCILYGVFRLIRYFISNWEHVKVYFSWVGGVLLGVIVIEIIGTILVKKYRQNRKLRMEVYNQIANREDSTWSDDILERTEQQIRGCEYEGEYQEAEYED